MLGSYSRERGTPKSWWPSLFTYPQIKDLPAHLTAGDPSFDRFDRDTRSLGYEFSHQTDSGWQLTQNLRYSTIDIDYRHIYAMDVLADGRSVSRASLAQRTKGPNAGAGHPPAEGPALGAGCSTGWPSAWTM